MKIAVGSRDMGLVLNLFANSEQISFIYLFFPFHTLELVLPAST